VGGGHFHTIRDLDPLLDAVVGGHNEVAALADSELTDDRDVRSPQNAHDFAFRPALVTNSRDVNQHAVAVHSLCGFARRKKDIALDAFYRLIGYYEPEPVPVHGKAARGVLAVAAHDNIMSGAELHQQSFARQPVQSVFKGIAVFALQPQLADELLEGGPSVRQPANVIQQAGVGEALLGIARMLRHYRNYRKAFRLSLTNMELKAIRLTIPENGNIIVGQSHFIKTVEDIYEAIVNTSPHIQFGVAFNEASGDCLTRYDGNDELLKQNAIQNAMAIGAGHVFVVALKNGFPINVLGRIQAAPEVANIYCATANPLEVIIAETDQGRGILGVIDGSSPKGLETDAHVKARVELLQKFGYKR
jgi:adenosine/AMP kinase